MSFDKLPQVKDCVRQSTAARTGDGAETGPGRVSKSGSTSTEATGAEGRYTDEKSRDATGTASTSTSSAPAGIHPTHAQTSRSSIYEISRKQQVWWTS